MDLFKSLLVFLSMTAVNATPPLLLTPYIKKNDLKDLVTARNLSKVNATQFLGVPSHAGYITVNEEYNSNLFFWYFPVTKKPVEHTPLIVWLQGGPGATSLVGLFEEIGPFHVNNNVLEKRLQWWGSDHSLLFIDSPVGAGYSFTQDNRGFIRDLNECGEQLYNFLQQFLSVFPEARAAPLYIAGESYAGRFVSALAHKVLNTEEATYGKRIIHLKGLIMGNPTFNLSDTRDLTGIFYHWGLIDKQGAIAVKNLQDAYDKAIDDKNSKEAYNLRYKLLDKLQEISMQPTFNILKDKDNVQSFVDFVTSLEVRQAIHVGSMPYAFYNNTVQDMLIADLLTDVYPIISQLLEKCRILIYCGQLDLGAACAPSAEARLRTLTWSHREHFLKAPRVPWEFQGTVAGYVKSGGGLTEVLVRGAGHLVPVDKSAEARQLVLYFTNDSLFPLPPNYIVDPNNTPDYTELTNEQKSTAMSTSTVITIISIVANVTLAVIMFYKKHLKNCNIYSRFQTQSNTDDTEAIAP